jgi:hypothetical protein
MGGLRHDIKAPILRVLSSWPALTRRIFVQRILGTAGPIGGFLLQHRGENFCQVMGRRGGGVGWPQCAPHAATKRPQRAGTRAETVRGPTQGPPGPIVDASTPRGQDVATPDRRIRTAAQPGRHMRVGRPWMPSEAHLGEDQRDRGSLHPRHLGEVDAGDPGARGPEIQGGCGAVRAPRRGSRRGEGRLLRSDEGIAGGEAALNVLIAGRDVLLRKIRAREGLGEGAHLCGAGIPLQRFGQGILVRLQARVPRLGSGLRIPFPCDHGAANAHPRPTWHSTHHVGQRAMHLIE